MLTRNNLGNVLLKYFLLFSLFILGILWFFQILFFNSFYKTQKTNDIKVVAEKIKKEENENIYEKINNLAFDKSVCIEVVDQNYDLLYSSTYFGKG